MYRPPKRRVPAAPKIVTTGPSNPENQGYVRSLPPEPQAPVTFNAANPWDGMTPGAQALAQQRAMGLAGMTAGAAPAVASPAADIAQQAQTQRDALAASQQANPQTGPTLGTSQTVIPPNTGDVAGTMQQAMPGNLPTPQPQLTPGAAALARRRAETPRPLSGV